jgi:hypothetical protein
LWTRWRTFWFWRHGISWLDGCFHPSHAMAPKVTPPCCTVHYEKLT